MDDGIIFIQNFIVNRMKKKGIKDIVNYYMVFNFRTNDDIYIIFLQKVISVVSDSDFNDDHYDVDNRMRFQDFQEKKVEETYIFPYQKIFYNDDVVHIED